jgi:NAD dependent epimerase/dehydratase
MRQPSDTRVLVTGADGFIGSHLVEFLLAERCQVRALVQYNSFNSWGWLDDSPAAAQAEVVAGDIRDPHVCMDLLRDIDVVFHLAALIPIPYSYRAPGSYVATNVTGTLNLCQAARAQGVAKFIQTSTSEVYGSAQYVPIDEKHPLVPQSPYSASKIAADAMALSFFYSFGLPVVLARPFNTYGPRQSARAVIPTIISQLASGARQVQLGDLTTTRDFTFVEDTCRGFAAIAALDGAAGETYNIGSNSEVSIGELFIAIAAAMGIRDAEPIRDEQRVRPTASEVLRLRCDDAKLAAAAGFRTRVTLEEGLARTVAWFGERQNLGRYKSGQYNV